jgi:hypothetical protein
LSGILSGGDSKANISTGDYCSRHLFISPYVWW